MAQHRIAPDELRTFASKDDQISMSYPFFALKKGGERHPRTFEDQRSGARIEILPSTIGSATIWDKDILIYLATLIRRYLDSGRTVGYTFSIVASDILGAIRRGSGGKDYRELEQALDRLVGTRFKTNLPTAHMVEKANFSMLAAYELSESSSGRMVSISVTVSEWLFRSIDSEAIVTIDPDYFLLTSGIARRTYEVLRKHIGKKSGFVIRLLRLQQKCGSDRNPRQFNHDLRKVIGATPTRLLDLWAFQDGRLLFVFRDKTVASHAHASRPKPPVPPNATSAIRRSGFTAASRGSNAFKPSQDPTPLGDIVNKVLTRTSR